jgi:hypothetical protein
MDEEEIVRFLHDEKMMKIMKVLLHVVPTETKWIKSF